MNNVGGDTVELTAAESARMLDKHVDRYGIPGILPQADLGAVMDRVNIVIQGIYIEENPKLHAKDIDIHIGTAQHIDTH